MADPYGNYLANQGLLSGPALNPKGIDPELLRQITGILSQTSPTPGLALPAGNMGYEVLQDAATAGKYAMGNPDRLTTDQIIPSVVNAASMAIAGGMPMAEAGAIGSAGGRLPANYRDAFNLGPRNEYLGGLPATPEAITARAAQQGYNPSETLYHGRRGEFEGMGFQKPDNSESAIFLTPDPEVANAYARRGENEPKGNEVMPLLARYQNPKEVDMGGGPFSPYRVSSILQEAKNQGHDAVWLRNMIDVAEHGGKLQDQLAIFDPAALRSKFAAFNPKYTGTSNLISARSVPFGLLSDRNQP
jgi:hypothetical protein